MSSSVTLLFAFFILLLFAARNPACADESDFFAVIRVHHEEQNPVHRMAHCDGSGLVLRVVRVWNRGGERITEDGRGLFESNPVLGAIRIGFLRIPDEPHSAAATIAPCLQRGSFSANDEFSGSHGRVRGSLVTVSAETDSHG